MPDTIGTALSVVALVVSLIVFLDNRIRDLRAARLARQPALVFIWDPTALLWSLRNIGNGPALDVVIAQRLDGSWSHPLRMPEMPVEGLEVVPRRWVEKFGSDPGLGAGYRSITDESYWTTTADDRSTISTGRRQPVIPIEEIEPHWAYRGASATSADLPTQADD